MKHLLYLYLIHICFIFTDQIISNTIVHDHINNNNNTYPSTTTNNNSNQNKNILSYERQALYDLYISTNGDDWIYPEDDNGTHWNFSDPNVNPCLSSNIWQGLNCTIETSSLSTLDSYYYISEIILSAYNLNGFIPDSISNFSYLKYLDLSYNTIYSVIPFTMGNLSELIELDLSYNSLSGTLSTSLYDLLELQVLNLDSNYYIQGTLSNLIGQLSQLLYLNLRINSLEGTIPFSICNLTELVELDLSYNSLSGTLPTSIYTLLELQVINLDSNYYIQGTLSNLIGQLSQLYYLNIKGNLFDGTIPHSIGNLTELIYLRLTINHFSGKIPNSLSKLTNLTFLSISSNKLSGSIPDWIGELSLLTYFSLGDNQLYGTIPNSLSKLTSLSTLSLSINKLSGTIPNRIGELSLLTYIGFFDNLLSGTVPYSLSNLTSLITLSVTYNQLSGTIPYWIGELSLLTYLYIGDNQFTGTIPQSLFKLRYINILSLSYNQISGTLPNWIGELSQLTSLSLGNNQLYGTIPSSLSNLTYLSILSLNYNKLSGTISNRIGELSLLKLLSLSDNQLYGTIPYSLSNLTSISALSLSINYLSGTIPDLIGELSQLTSLSLDTNQLYGTIPHSLSNLTQIEEIYFENNYLIGSIPNIFKNLIKLYIIELNDNYFTGKLPDSLSQLQFLSYLFLQNNHFSGHLNNIFNGSYQKHLNNIQLSNNKFTGKLPEQVFLSQSLVSFSAVSNCFHGSIPHVICMNTNLSTLALDGLVCASSCRNKIIPSISSAYLSNNEITGGIPHCLWSMPNLQVLHLSGNSLTGSLPDNIYSNSLIDLSLSYNMLTGSIPSYSIQERAWRNLDLSHNRISGTLRSNYASQSTNASLSLKNNRLSGTIPNYLLNMKDISILEGSYYDCKYDRSDLPAHDNNKYTYECGSNVFNISYYLWLGLVFLLSSSILVAWYYRNDINDYIQVSTVAIQLRRWVNIIESVKLYYELEINSQSLKQQSFLYFKAYIAIQDIISRFSLYSTLLVLAILLPVYIILSKYYFTHTYEYAWTVSILYLSGEIAFGIVMSILIIFVIIQVYIFYYSIKHSIDIQVFGEIKQQSKKDLNDKIVNKDTSNQWKNYSMYLIYILINFAIVGGANIAYVYVVLYQSNQIIILCQILLSIFKMVWNTIISPKMVLWIINNLSVINKTNRVIQRRLFILQFVVSLFNNILIPCLIVAIISPNCFYHIFNQESDITSSFSYQECLTTDQFGNCIEYKTLTSSTKYSPPFTYSYQCSSDFVTYYASVFVLMCLMSTFFVPIINYIILKLSKHYHCISNLYKIPKILKLDKNDMISSLSLLAINDIYELLVSILTMVGLLLTFGVVFPPLAVAFLLAIYRRIYYHKTIIGRYISKALECKTYSCLDIIEEDCKVIPLLSTIQLCGWILLYLSCIFYTLFVFDILGDDVGVKKAYWVLIVMPCIPICLHILYKLYNYRTKINNKQDNNILTNSIVLDDGIELSTPTIMVSNPLSTKDTGTIIAIDNIYDSNI